MSNTIKRPCGVKPTTLNNAYTKNELVKKVVSKSILTEEEAKKTSLKELCDLLGLDTTVHTKQSGDDECKTLKKNQLIEKYASKLMEQGIDAETAKEMAKDNLCDIIFDLQSNIVVPSDFTEKTCKLYDLDQLKRIARKLGIEYQTSDDKEILCKSIRIEYFIKKNNITFNADKSPQWTDLIKSDYECLIPESENLKLEEHQTKVAKHMLTHRSLLAVHSVGSGKTLSAVTAINCILAKYPNIKVTIITPLSLKQNFKDEMKKFGINMDEIGVAARIKIFSYEGFTNYYKKHKDYCKNNFLIVDEAHNLRSEVKMSKLNKISKGGRAYYILKCAASAFKVLLLTATPMINRPFDLRNLLMMLDGTDPEKAESLKYFQTNILGSEKVFNDQFKCKVSVYSINKDAKEYPARINEPIRYITMSDEYYKKYRRIEDKEQITGSFAHLVGSDEMFYASLRRAVNALDGVESPKIKEIVDFIVSEAKAGRKSVVFSNWKTAGMNLLRSRLDTFGIKNLYSYISGDITPHHREIFRDKINKDISKILLISRAGGEGLNLKGIRNVIIMESNWNASTDEQIIGRAIRKYSHAHLPEKDRTVRVFRYMMKKPDYAANDKLRSIDEVLYDLAYVKKQPLMDKYLQSLIDASIEKNSCPCKDDVTSTQQGCDVKFLTSEKGGKKTEEEKKKLEEEKKKLEEERKQSLTQEDLDAQFVYKAPGSSTSIALDIGEVGLKSFKKLAGITGDIIKRKVVVFEEEDSKEVEEEVQLRVKKRKHKVVLEDDDIVIEGNSPALDPDEEEYNEEDPVEADAITSSQEAESGSDSEIELEIKPRKTVKKTPVVFEDEEEVELKIKPRKIVKKTPVIFEDEEEVDVKPKKEKSMKRRPKYWKRSDLKEEDEVKLKIKPISGTSDKTKKASKKTNISFEKSDSESETDLEDLLKQLGEESEEEIYEEGEPIIYRKELSVPSDFEESEEEVYEEGQPIVYRPKGSAGKLFDSDISESEYYSEPEEEVEASLVSDSD